MSLSSSRQNCFLCLGVAEMDPAESASSSPSSMEVSAAAESVFFTVPQ
jgi:hypothetical protein